ncbi:hypothetical protein Dda_1093 [Drechslerella dactyloides]|uniref:Uncharacterized protein n=1 Tax=Drechslerella dactyloides TaxID=74499 RepID=A0AAD6NNW5_DREDA|nr:hypothetical protein Dda_1093 [Drechslerella dactyloides]
MWPPTSICLLIVVSAIGLVVEALPLKQWPIIPNRQLHWTGLYMTNPAYATGNPPTSIDTEYQKFLKSKASGQNPTATFRPDSWSQYNYHVETHALKAREQPESPTRTGASLSAEEKAIETSCASSRAASESKAACAREAAEDLRQLRRGLYAGSTIAVLGGIIIGLIYFLNSKFFQYFDYKERWHVEKARHKSIKRVNRTIIKTGDGAPFPENIDYQLLDQPPSKFWAGIFESECFIATLFFIERRTKVDGKWTGIMKRPKLGDELSGIPLNSLRARRKYGGRGPSGPAVPRGFVAGEARKASGAELPAPVGSLHRRGRSSRAASISSLRAQFNVSLFDTSETTDNESTQSGILYQMPSGFGESPLSNGENKASGGDP